jgi:hypothetical protein
MFGSQLFLVDPDLRPRRGQKVTLDYLGQEIPGKISAVSGTGLEIRPDSLSLLRHVPPNAHLRLVVVARNGVSEIVLTQFAVVGDVLRGQVVGCPVSIQRRTDERVAVPVEATLAWLDPQLASPVQGRGVTANLCVAGALLRFHEPLHQLPHQDAVALLGLQVPDVQGPLALSVRVLQAWQDGARLHIIDAAPPVAAQLRTFVESQLRGGRAC